MVFFDNKNSSPILGEMRRRYFSLLVHIGYGSETKGGGDGSGKTKTTTASITANGQSVSVTLAYEFVIYQNGSFGKNSAGTAFDAKNTDDNNASSITKNSAYMLWTCGAWAVCTFYITPKFSCAGYKTLKISVTNASTVLDSSSKGAWGLKSGPAAVRRRRGDGICPARVDRGSPSLSSRTGVGIAADLRSRTVLYDTSTLCRIRNLDRRGEIGQHYALHLIFGNVDLLGYGFSRRVRRGQGVRCVADRREKYVRLC